MRACSSFLRSAFLLIPLALVMGWFVGEPVVLASQVSDKSRVQANSLQLAQSQPSSELKLLMSGRVPPDAVTSRTPSPIAMSLPSLWWVSEQIANFEKYGPKLIQEWIAYPVREGQSGQVDLLVNRQLWSLLDYLQRYELVSRFSAVARSYGYNTRVYDNPDRPPVAIYSCKFTAEDLRQLQEVTSDRVLRSSTESYVGRDEIANRLTCDLDLDSINRPNRFTPTNTN